MQMRKKYAVSALLLLTLCGCGADPAAQEAKSLDLFAMDTYMNLKAYGSHADAALKASADRITGLEKLLSVTDAGSEIYAANHADGAAVGISPDTETVLDMAAKVYAESRGALNIAMYPVLQAWGFTTGAYQVPDGEQIAALLAETDFLQVTVRDSKLTVPAGMQIDLGALAKGYAGECVMECMRENSVKSAIISLGGNVQAIGSKPDGSAWKVGITNPFLPDENLGILQVTDSAVITSGNYERYFEGDDGQRYWHILDPADGFPADNGIVSATVIGTNGLYCDALSTALFVEGADRAAAHWRAAQDFQAVLVTEDARILITAGIQDGFENLTEMPVEVIAP